jgi:hypothetical protein
MYVSVDQVHNRTSVAVWIRCLVAEARTWAAHRIKWHGILALATNTCQTKYEVAEDRADLEKSYSPEITFVNTRRNNQ